MKFLFATAALVATASAFSGGDPSIQRRGYGSRSGYGSGYGYDGSGSGYGSYGGYYNTEVPAIPATPEIPEIPDYAIPDYAATKGEWLASDYYDNTYDKKWYKSMKTWTSGIDGVQEILVDVKNMKPDKNVQKYRDAEQGSKKWLKYQTKAAGAAEGIVEELTEVAKKWSGVVEETLANVPDYTDRLALFNKETYGPITIPAYYQDLAAARVLEGDDYLQKLLANLEAATPAYENANARVNELYADALAARDAAIAAL